MSLKNCGYTLSKSFVLNYSFASQKRYYYCNIEDESMQCTRSVKCSDKIKLDTAATQ